MLLACYRCRSPLRHGASMDRAPRHNRWCARSARGRPARSSSRAPHRNARRSPRRAVAETTVDEAGVPLPLPTHQVTHQLHLGGRFPDVAVNDVRDRLFAVIEAQRCRADDKHIAKPRPTTCPTAAPGSESSWPKDGTPTAPATQPGPCAQHRWSSSWPSTHCTRSTTSCLGPPSDGDRGRVSSWLHPGVLRGVGVPVGQPWSTASGRSSKCQGSLS